MISQKLVQAPTSSQLDVEYAKVKKAKNISSLFATD